MKPFRVCGSIFPDWTCFLFTMTALSIGNPWDRAHCTTSQTDLGQYVDFAGDKLA
jgi:hypothetical protein